ncbi:MAG TPA: hypothetical protein VGF17_28490, partial [Phytomonospora sp.]
MEFASAAANVLGRLSAGGHGAISVQRRGDDGSFREPSTVDAVREEMVALATGIAARFDARNATTRQSDRTRARIGAEAVGDAPLTVLGGRGREREAPEITALVDAVTAANADPRSTGPAKLALIAALDTAGRHADAVEVAEEAMSEFGRLGLTPELQRCGLALAELYGHLRRTTDAVRVLDELLAADDGTLPRSRVLCRIADLTPMSAARQLAAADDRAATGDGREAHYLLRAIRFGGCGDDDLRKTAVDRLVPLVVGIDDAELRNEARWTLAMARHDERDLDDACRLLREMLSDGVQALFRQACLDHLASYLTELGRFEEAMEVVTDWAAVDGEDGLEGKLHVLRILRRQGREDEALRQEEEWGIDPKEFEGG